MKQKSGLGKAVSFGKLTGWYRTVPDLACRNWAGQLGPLTNRTRRDRRVSRVPGVVRSTQGYSYTSSMRLVLWLERCEPVAELSSIWSPRASTPSRRRPTQANHRELQNHDISRDLPPGPSGWSLANDDDSAALAPSQPHFIHIFLSQVIL